MAPRTQCLEVGASEKASFQILAGRERCLSESGTSTPEKGFTISSEATPRPTLSVSNVAAIQPPDQQLAAGKRSAQYRAVHGTK
jgi:hypothetical protein